MFITIFYVLLAVGYVLVLVYVVYTIFAMRSAAPFVPTFKKKCRRMLEMAEVSEDDVVMDLGSGDGRLLFLATKKARKVVGIEINPLLYYYSIFKRWLRRAYRVEIRREDLWKTDLSDVDVLTLFFIQGKMDKLADKIRSEMKPGSRVVSNTFTFSTWQPAKKDGSIYLYIV